MWQKIKTFEVDGKIKSFLFSLNTFITEEQQL